MNSVLVTQAPFWTVPGITIQIEYLTNGPDGVVQCSGPYTLPKNVNINTELNFN